MEISLLNETRNEIDVHYGRKKIVWKIGSFIHVFKCISAKIAGKEDCRYINLKRVSIRNETFIRRNLSILNSAFHVNTN